MERPPISGAYWVDPGRLLAGEYPGTGDEELTRERLARLDGAGIGIYVDLTEEGELTPYAHLLDGARHVRMPIHDMDTTSHERYCAMLDLLDEGLSSGVGVYVHCYGGVGRTGTVVGCWLVRHGLDGGDPIGHIASLRGALDTWRQSPETAEQRRVVLEWTRGG
jgi:polymorphic toxin system DSP-PTPase phosphatase-like protein